MTDSPYAELLVDTARASTALGVRGGVGDRQLVYRHAGVQLDVVLHSGGPTTTFLWGQVCRAGSGRPCQEAAVTLLDEDARAVADARTDVFGEFSFAAPRIFEGALAVETGAGRFLCWLTPRPMALPCSEPGGPRT